MPNNKIEYTFIQEKLGHFSNIDHFYVSHDSACVVAAETIEHFNNCSDHLPLSLRLSSDIHKLCSEPSNIASDQSTTHSYQVKQTAITTVLDTSQLNI